MPRKIFAALPRLALLLLALIPVLIRHRQGPRRLSASLTAAQIATVQRAAT